MLVELTYENENNMQTTTIADLSDDEIALVKNDIAGVIQSEKIIRDIYGNSFETGIFDAIVPIPMGLTVQGFVKIAEKGDYKKAYDDYKRFEEGFNDAEITANIVNYNTFVEQLKLGYNGSDINQIARLIETDDGIWYDNEYVRV